MAKKIDNNHEENLRKYQERIKMYTKQELTPPDHELTIDELAVEGAILLAKEGKTEDPIPKPSPVVSSKNPYLQARNQVLNKYPEWKRIELLRMEKDNKTDNYTYKEFVKEVRMLGDSLSG
jgi:hypothetical protein